MIQWNLFFKAFSIVMAIFIALLLYVGLLTYFIVSGNIIFYIIVAVGAVIIMVTVGLYQDLKGDKKS